MRSAITILGVLTAVSCVIGCTSEDEKTSSSSPSASTSEPSSNEPTEASAPMLQIEQKEFGKTADGETITEYILSNGTMKVTMIDYGATVTAIETPDRDGKLDNIVLYHNSLENWLVGGSYFGATCGRYANRIAKGKFSIDGNEYTLATNNDPNHLHGGEVGFNRKLWKSEPVETSTHVGVAFTYVSPDGEEGYPGELTSRVVYSLSTDNELKIEYQASSTKPTPINLTNHNYWNLAGSSGESAAITDHELTLMCDRYLPVDETMIPTGELKAVEGTPMDFTSAHKIGERLAQVEGGYDHCYVVNGGGGDSVVPTAQVHDPATGRMMEISTDQPGIQFYSGNFLDGSDGSGGFEKHHGFCLETQVFPDSPNQSSFPNSILKPGDTYTHTTVHRFSAK